MLKRTWNIIAACVMALAAVACAAPGGTTDPGQQLLNATTDTCKANVAAIKSFNAAVMAGVLKGDNARNGLKALEATQASCNNALATFQAAVAASGASK